MGEPPVPVARHERNAAQSSFEIDVFSCSKNEAKVRSKNAPRSTNGAEMGLQKDAKIHVFYRFSPRPGHCEGLQSPLPVAQRGPPCAPEFHDFPTFRSAGSDFSRFSPRPGHCNTRPSLLPVAQRSAGSDFSQRPIQSRSQESVSSMIFYNIAMCPSRKM